nr:hypothetical protein [Campylobacter sp.]
MLKKLFLVIFLTCFLKADCNSELDNDLKDVKFPIVNGVVTLEKIFCDNETININFIIEDTKNFRKEKFRDEFQKEFIEKCKQKYCSANHDDFIDSVKNRNWLLEVRTKSGKFTFWKGLDKNQCK